MVGDKKRRLSGKILTGAFALPVAVSTVQQNVASANLSDDLFLQENDKIGHTLGKLKDLVKEQNFYDNGFVFGSEVVTWTIKDLFDEESLKVLEDVAKTAESDEKDKDIKELKVKSFNEDGTITFSFVVNGKIEKEITSKKIDDDFDNVMKIFFSFLKLKFEDNSEGFRLRALHNLMLYDELFKTFFAEGISFTSDELYVLFSNEDLAKIKNIKGEKTFRLKAFYNINNTFSFDVLVDGQVKKEEVKSKPMKMDLKGIMQVINFLFKKATENKKHLLKVVEKQGRLFLERYSKGNNNVLLSSVEFSSFCGKEYNHLTDGERLEQMHFALFFFPSFFRQEKFLVYPDDENIDFTGDEVLNCLLNEDEKINIENTKVCTEIKNFKGLVIGNPVIEKSLQEELIVETELFKEFLRNSMGDDSKKVLKIIEILNLNKDLKYGIKIKFNNFYFEEAKEGENQEAQVKLSFEMEDWYKNIYYTIPVADGCKKFFDFINILFSISKERCPEIKYFFKIKHGGDWGFKFFIHSKASTNKLNVYSLRFYNEPVDKSFINNVLKNIGAQSGCVKWP